MRKLGLVLVVIALILSGCYEEELPEELPEKELPEIEIEQAFCGDGSCDGDENKCSCPEDCGECAGDVADKVCVEFSCVDEECKEVVKKACCGNGICEQGEELCDDCPSCNDYDKCTKDWFDPIELKCYNEVITPCCGNGVCEKGESCDNCLDDCECGIGLEDYPDFFKRKSGFIIVGAKAPSSDVAAGMDISGGLTDVTQNFVSALDNEILSLDSVNAIVIGTPCDNKWSAELLPYKRDCLEYVEKGKAVIRLFKTGENSYAVLVFGYGVEDTRRAALLLKDYKKADLEGTEMIV